MTAEISTRIALFLAGLLVMLLVGACGPATPTPLSTPPEPTAIVPGPPTPPFPTTELPLSVPTDTPTPLPTPTELTATPSALPTQTPVPQMAELKAMIVAGLPPTPTPDVSDEWAVWGADVGVLPLAVTAGSSPLWAVFTIGMGFYDPKGHFVAIYTHDDRGWRELDRVVLPLGAEYINSDSLKQVQIDPGRIWLEIQSGGGAHGGGYDLLSFDGQVLRTEVSHGHDSPNAGWLKDLDGNGIPEVILNQTENYVFCYACGMRLPLFQVLRWDGKKLIEVHLAALPEALPDDVHCLNYRAVELAQAGLWQDAQRAIAEALRLDLWDPALAETVAWNAILIDLHADALREQVDNGAYPLLDNLFYGDYAAALDAMRPYSMEEIWGPDSPLIVDTVAEGWELDLSRWISWTTNLALQVRPDLAAASFLRGWAFHLWDPGKPVVLSYVERAARLDSADPLFSEAVTYLKEAMPAVPTAVVLSEAVALKEYYGLALDYDSSRWIVQLVEYDTESGMWKVKQDGPFTRFEHMMIPNCQIREQGPTDSIVFDEPITLGEIHYALAVFFDAAHNLYFRWYGAWEGLGGASSDAALFEVTAPAENPEACIAEVEKILATLHTSAAASGPTPVPSVTEPSATPTTTPAVGPTLTARPKATAVPTPVTEERWQVRTLLAGPGPPGRLYALLANTATSAWPAERVRFLVSDDYGQTWSTFPGGLPAEECVRNVNLDYATADALYASTCQGLYRWLGGQWALVSPQETGLAAVVYGQPQTIWATGIFGSAPAVMRSGDAGATWTQADSGLMQFNGVANLGIDPRDANTLYAVIWPKYAGSYLRRGTGGGQWQTLPTPQNNSQIDVGMTIDGATGALYVTAFTGAWGLWRAMDPRVPDVNAVQWEQVHDFGPEVSWATLLASGWSPEGLALYANLSAWIHRDTGEVGPPVLHRSLDGGQTWSPLPIR